MTTKSSLIEASLTGQISRYLKGEKPTILCKDCIFLLYETNKLLHAKNLLSATDRYCEFLLPLYNFYEVNSRIENVRNDLEENLRRCLRFVEKGYAYSKDEISFSKILDWLVDDFVTLTNQRLPIFYEYEKFRAKQIRKKFTVNT